MSKIELKHIDKFYGKNHILKDVNLTIEDGDFMTLLGPSGCGKSTLLSLICGLMKPQTGEILLNGEPVLGNSPQIGYMLQHDHLFEWRTIYRNILLGPEISHTLNKEIREKAKSMLTQYGLKSFIHARPSQLSGGMRQRAALIRTLLPEPELLLLDEPFSALDAKIRQQMREELKKIQSDLGITVIFVTHDQEEALSMSDTVVVMNEGTIQQIGTPIDIYNEPENRFVAGFIGESNIIEGVMIKDFLVAFDDFEFICVDKGFPENEPVDVVIRPEDIDIVQPDKANLKGIVKSVTFKGVHYETIVTTKYRDYRIDTTDYFAVGLEVGLTFTPEDIHVMWQMGSY